MRLPKAVIREVQCPHFGTSGRSTKGTRGPGTRFSLIWEQFWDPALRKNYWFYQTELSLLSFDGSVIILSRRETSCGNFKGFTLCRRPLLASHGYQKLSLVRFSASILVPWGEAGRARGGPEPDFHWFGVNVGTRPPAKTIIFILQDRGFWVLMVLWSFSLEGKPSASTLRALRTASLSWV